MLGEAETLVSADVIIYILCTRPHTIAPMHVPTAPLNCVYCWIPNQRLGREKPVMRKGSALPSGGVPPDGIPPVPRLLVLLPFGPRASRDSERASRARALESKALALAESSVETASAAAVAALSRAASTLLSLRFTSEPSAVGDGVRPTGSHARSILDLMLFALEESSCELAEARAAPGNCACNPVHAGLQSAPAGIAASATTPESTSRALLAARMVVIRHAASSVSEWSCEKAL